MHILVTNAVRFTAYVCMYVLLGQETRLLMWSCNAVC